MVNLNIRAAKRRSQALLSQLYSTSRHQYDSGWNPTIVLLPRKTITGKYRIGKLLRREISSYYNQVMGIHGSVFYATDREAFMSKLIDK